MGANGVLDGLSPDEIDQMTGLPAGKKSPPSDIWRTGMNPFGRDKVSGTALTYNPVAGGFGYQTAIDPQAENPKFNWMAVDPSNITAMNPEYDMFKGLDSSQPYWQNPTFSGDVFTGATVNPNAAAGGWMLDATGRPVRPTLEEVGSGGDSATVDWRVGQETAGKIGESMNRRSGGLANIFETIGGGVLEVGRAVYPAAMTAIGGYLGGPVGAAAGGAMGGLAESGTGTGMAVGGAAGYVSGGGLTGTPLMGSASEAAALGAGGNYLDMSGPGGAEYMGNLPADSSAPDLVSIAAADAAVPYGGSLTLGQAATNSATNYMSDAYGQGFAGPMTYENVYNDIKSAVPGMTDEQYAAAANSAITQYTSGMAGGEGGVYDPGQANTDILNTAGGGTNTEIVKDIKNTDVADIIKNILTPVGGGTNTGDDDGGGRTTAGWRNLLKQQYEFNPQMMGIGPYVPPQMKSGVLTGDTAAEEYLKKKKQGG